MRQVDVEDGLPHNQVIRHVQADAGGKRVILKNNTQHATLVRDYGTGRSISE